MVRSCVRPESPLTSSAFPALLIFLHARYRHPMGGSKTRVPSGPPKDAMSESHAGRKELRPKLCAQISPIIGLVRERPGTDSRIRCFTDAPGDPTAMYLRGIVFALVGALSFSSTSIAADWPMYGHDIGQSRSNPGEITITTAKIASLKQLWVFKTAAPVSATPTVVNGVVYFGSWDHNFYAVNAA